MRPPNQLALCPNVSISFRGVYYYLGSCDYLCLPASLTISVVCVCIWLTVQTLTYTQEPCPDEHDILTMLLFLSYIWESYQQISQNNVEAISCLIFLLHFHISHRRLVRYLNIYSVLNCLLTYLHTERASVLATKSHIANQCFIDSPRCAVKHSCRNFE